MSLKVIQLNLWKGRFFDEACEFLRSESPDVVFLQEVTTGGLNLYKDQKADLFEELKVRLGISGVYDCVMRFKQLPDDCFGNAILSKLPIIKSQVVTMRDGGLFEYDFEHKGDLEKDRPYVPRHLLDAEIDAHGTKIHAICIHGAWTRPPTDTGEALRQADIIVDHIKSLGDEPFIVGGDFNMPPESKVIKKISAVSKNLMEGLDISQTLNPRIHTLKDKGFLVDYIFTSWHFSVKSIEIAQVDISDHLPVVAEVDFSA